MTDKGDLKVYVNNQASGALIGKIILSNSNNNATADVDASGHLQVDVITAPSTAVTNVGTFVTQINGDALTALQLIDNLAVAVDGNYLNVNMNVAGTDVAANAGTLNDQTLRVS